MNLIQDAPNDWTVSNNGHETFIHKNDDGTFTNSRRVGFGGHKGGMSQPCGGPYQTLDAAYTAALLD